MWVARVPEILSSFDFGVCARQREGGQWWFGSHFEIVDKLGVRQYVWGS